MPLFNPSTTPGGVNTQVQFNNAGAFGGDADFTFAGDTLTATKIVAPTSLSTPSLISTGALTITPLAGSNLNVALSTTGDFAVNTNQLYVDTSTGNVGIGTTDMSASGRNGKLCVAGGHLNLDDTYALVWGGTTGRTSITGSKAGGTLNFELPVASAATNVFSFNSGNVGIGTTGPLAKLHVVYSGNAYTAASSDATRSAFESPNVLLSDSYGTLSLISNTAQGVDLGGSIALGGRYIDSSEAAATFAVIKGAKETSTSQNEASYLAFGTRADNAGITEKMRITSAGNVGIGTTGPATSALLDLTSTSGALLVPRMTTTQKNALTAVNGMIVYDTTLAKFQGYEAGAWAAFSIL